MYKYTKIEKSNEELLDFVKNNPDNEYYIVTNSLKIPINLYHKTNKFFISKKKYTQSNYHQIEYLVNSLNVNRYEFKLMGNCCKFIHVLESQPIKKFNEQLNIYLVESVDYPLTEWFMNNRDQFKPILK